MPKRTEGHRGKGPSPKISPSGPKEKVKEENKGPILEAKNEHVSVFPAANFRTSFS